MKIIAMEVEKPGLGAADFAPHLEAEARRVWELQQDDIIREIYFNTEKHCAVLVLEAESKAAAQAILETLPLVQAGLITFDLILLAPYPGYGRLFREP